MFERFAEAARQSLFFARIHAAERRGDAIDIEDLLRGVLTAAPETVSRFTSDLAALHSSNSAESQRRPGEEMETWVKRLFEADWFDGTRREIPFDAATKAALRCAETEANEFEHATIRPEHLLLGILRQEGTAAWQLLMNAGVTLRAMRSAMSEEQ